MSFLAKYKNGYWIGGSLTAISGALVARFVGSSIADEKLRVGLVLAGQLCALLGLFIIALGVRRRLRIDGEALERSEAQETQADSRKDPS